MEEKILVSSCLLGVPCRWHGKKLYLSSYVKRFLRENPQVKLIPVCPEMLGGLPCPRPPIKRKNGRAFFTCDDKRYRKQVTLEEVTGNLILGSRKTLDIARANNVKQAILCNWSPSCDRTGFTGKLLTQKGVKVVNSW